MNLPSQLQDPAFRFVLLGSGKGPIEKNWQENANYPHDHPRIKAANRVGVLCGVGGLVVVDFDTQEAQDQAEPALPPTFTVRTGGSGLHHLYFKTDTPKTVRYNKDDTRLLDLQGPKTQVVGPGSKNPETGRYYEVVRDLPIVTITMTELEAILARFFTPDAQPGQKRERVQNATENGNDAISELKRGAPLLAVLAHYGIHPKNNKALCPLHNDKNPSMSVDGDQWYCHACRIGGDQITLIEKADGIPRAKAIHRLAQLSGQNWPPRDEKQKQEPAVDPNKEEYLRTISEGLVRGIGYRAAAEALVRRNPIYYDRTRSWWGWNPTTLSWVELDETDIIVIAQKTLALLGDTSVKHTRFIIEALRQVGREQAPAALSPEWIQFQGELVNFQTGERRPSTPATFSTNPIPWRVGKSTETLVMDALIESWVGVERVPTVYEIIAYCLIRDYPIHRLFCFVGSGANGKTRVFRIIEKLVGKENICSTSLERLVTNRFETAGLRHKLVAFLGETTHHQLDSTSQIKALTGQDPITFEDKGKRQITETNYAKICVGTNNLPPSADTSRGWYRRQLILPFPNEFQEGPDIVATIPDLEFENLCAKALSILPDLLKGGTFTGEGSIDDRRAEFVKHSNPIGEFLAEFYERDPEGRTDKEECFNKYLQFLAERKLRRIKSREFTPALEDEGLTCYRTTRKAPDGALEHWDCIRGIRTRPAQRNIQKATLSTVSPLTPHARIEMSGNSLDKPDFWIFSLPLPMDKLIARLGEAYPDRSREELRGIIAQAAAAGDIYENPIGFWRRKP